MRFAILGPLEITDGDRGVRLGGRRLRTLLAVLLVHANEVVSTAELVAAVELSSGSDRPVRALRTQVSRLRAVIDPVGSSDRRRLVNRGNGYCLEVCDDELDAFVFERLSKQCRGSLARRDWRAVLDSADRGLSCWRGDAFTEFRDADFVRARAARLEEERRLTVECRGEAALAMGQHRELICDLQDLVVAHPLREAFWAQLIVALYRSGRQSDALRAFDRVRQMLADELGIGPGVQLLRLQQAMLEQDPALVWQPGPASFPDSRGSDAGGPPDPFPAGLPATNDPSRHNLPRPLTSLVGRADERERVADALRRSRLLTLTGSAGCGKTRLALIVGEDLLDEFSGGVWWIDLAVVAHPALVARAMAAPLGVDTGGAGQLAQVCRYLGDRKVLLILDNCEHVVEAVVEVTDEVLRRCPEVRILATSREELGVVAGQEWRVPPLSLPAVNGAGYPAPPNLRSEAVELFIERGRSALRDFAPTGESLAAVAQICRQLDGLPLAVELAASLVGRLPVAEIAARLGDRFDLLTRHRRHGAERHQTLRAALDWSFDLLDARTGVLFAQLGVFVGDFNLAAAEAVAGSDSDPMQVVRGLSRLVASSMVGCVAGSQGAQRYRMLETLKQYATQQLEVLGIAEVVRRRHARYYADFAANAERDVHGPTASQWLAELLSNLPNLRAAVAWTIEHDEVDTGLRLMGSLRWYFARMALLEEAGQWLEVWLNRGSELARDRRLIAVTAASIVAFSRGQFDKTRRLGEQGVALARQLDDLHELATALIVRGWTAVYEGDIARGEQCLDEAEGLCTRLGDRWATGWALTGRGVGSRRSSRLDRARQQLEEALFIFRALDDEHGQVLPLVHLALAAQEEGNKDEALMRASDAVAIAGRIPDRQLQHISLCVLGRIELSVRHLYRSRELLLRSIRKYPDSQHRLMLAIALEGLAELAGLAGRHSDAAALLGFTEQLREGWQLTMSSSRAQEHRRWLEEASATLGPERFGTDLARGRALSLDRAVDLAAVATAEFAADTHDG